MTHPTLLEIAPHDVHSVVGRHLLVDAFDFVFDLEKSRGIEIGMLVLPCGSRSVRFRPPLTLTRSEADPGLDMLRRALQSLLGGSGQ